MKRWIVIILVSLGAYFAWRKWGHVVTGAVTSVTR